MHGFHRTVMICAMLGLLVIVGVVVFIPITVVVHSLCVICKLYQWPNVNCANMITWSVSVWAAAVTAVSNQLQICSAQFMQLFTVLQITTTVFRSLLHTCWTYGGYQILLSKTEVLFLKKHKTVAKLYAVYCVHCLLFVLAVHWCRCV